MENTKMDDITDEFASYICDHICKYQEQIKDEDALADVCTDCKMGRFICDILNQYNKINDFDKTQSFKLMQQLCEERAKMIHGN